MITSDWADLLRCSSCGSAYENSGEALICRRCSIRFPVVDGIPLLIKDTTVGTALEQVDYDEAHGVNDQLIRSTGVEWMEIIGRLGIEPGRVLEIGAGTGVLTMGLMQQAAVGEVIATDVSHKFLQILARRTAPLSTPLALVACDANEPHFRNDVFDLVVGRSILHHLLDYELTLKQSCAVLKPGGAAMFYEPVLDGKTIVTLMLAMVLACDEKTTAAVLSPEDRDAIRRQVRHQMKSVIGPQDRRTLSTREDKYIFEIERMKEVGRQAGFADVEFLSRTQADPTYWPYVVQTCQNIGVPAEKLQHYKWIGEQFAETYGLIFPERLVPPMGYFVFRKAAAGTAASASAAPAKSAAKSAPEPARLPAHVPKAVRSLVARTMSSDHVPSARIVAGFARAGLSVRGAHTLQVRDRTSGAQQRALVFVVSHKGKRYLIAPDSKTRWARNLRAAGVATLQVGRRTERIRAIRATQEADPKVFDRWQRQTAPLGLAETDAKSAHWLVFRIEPRGDEPSS